MDMLLKTHGDGGAELPDDDPQTSYLISAWSRICKVSKICKFPNPPDILLDILIY